MSGKISAIISVILTVIVLIVFAVLSIFFEMVALNGFSSRQGGTAMGISLACQGAGMFLAGIFAGWFTNFLITKFNWNQILAVVAAVAAGALLGGAVSFLSIIIAILSAVILHTAT